MGYSILAKAAENIVSDAISKAQPKVFHCNTVNLPSDILEMDMGVLTDGPKSAIILQAAQPNANVSQRNVLLNNFYIGDSGSTATLLIPISGESFTDLTQYNIWAAVGATTNGVVQNGRRLYVSRMQTKVTAWQRVNNGWNGVPPLTIFYWVLPE